MYRLYLVRHAEADCTNPTDFVRILNKTGEKQAHWTGEQLKQRELIPDIIVPSPANRTFNTAKIIANILGLEENRITPNPDIYQASLNKLLKVIHHFEPLYQGIMLVGHNPGISLLNSYLTNTETQAMPNGSVSIIDFDLDTWQNLIPGEGTQVLFLYPP